MNSAIPYSTALFPTLTKLCSVFDKDMKSVCILLKHKNFDDFLDRLETTVYYYFDAKKIDCSYEKWEECACKIIELFLGANDFFGINQVLQLNNRVFRCFVDLEYGMCNDPAESRLERFIEQTCPIQGSFLNRENEKIAEILQKILTVLVVEAKELNGIPNWIEQHNKKLKSANFLLNNSDLKLGIATLTVTPQQYSEAQLLFKNYPCISFEKDKKSIRIKEVKPAQILKLENSLKLIESKKTSEDLTSIFISVKAVLEISKFDEVELQFYRDTKLSKNITPFLFNEQIETEILSKKGSIFYIKENCLFSKNVKKIHSCWELYKSKQECFFDFCIKKLGDLIKENGVDFMKFTNHLGKKYTITSYPGSVKVLKETSYKKYFNDMLKEHLQCIEERNRNVKETKQSLMNFIDDIQEVNEEDKLNLINSVEFQMQEMMKRIPKKGRKQKNIEETPQNDKIKTNIKPELCEREIHIDSVHNEKPVSKEILKETKIEVFNKKESFVRKAKKVEDCVKQTVKVLKKPKPTVYSIVTPSTLQMAIKPQPKAISFPGEPFPYKKELRVLRWEEIDFDKALTVEDFSDHNYCMLSDLDQKWAKIIHNPNEYIDNFAYLGLNELWHSKEKNEEHPCISVLTEITYMNKSYRGLMQWTFNKSQTHLYHKCFKYEFEKNDPLKKTLKEFDYPRLYQHEKKIQCGSTLIITRDNGTVTLIDKKRDLTVQLLKG